MIHARLRPESSLFLLVDVQDRLFSVMDEAARTVAEKNMAIALEGCGILDVRVAVTEQYKKGLGATISSLDERARKVNATYFEKLAFSIADDPAAKAWIASENPTDVIVAGMETHICVLQTVRDLLLLGKRVTLLGDAVLSRKDSHRELALRSAVQMGASVVPTESVLFDWMGQAGTDSFRAVSKLVR
ncbi:MAG: isochorismatase family protein [Polyangiaceae bacterium]|nr:isochorismatase family protein [Polyangiaceae bacterium]